MNYIKVTDVENSVEFQFNNDASGNDGCLLSDISGFEDSISINTIEDIASRIGAIGVNSKSGRRLISFTARLMCNTLQQRRNMMAALRRTGYLKLIQFQTVDSTPLTLRMMAYFDRLNAPYKSSPGKPMLLQFSAPDPRLYSDAENTDTIPRNSSVVVPNAGNEITNPVFRVHGPFTNVVITNLNNNQSISITETLVAGEWIEIDTVANTAVDDTGASVYASLDGTPDFIVLEPGDNTIQFSDTGGDANTELDVTWRDAYNGV